MSYDTDVEIKSTISKSEISLYDNKYFDTSAFTYVDYAKEFENYQVESSKLTTYRGKD